MLPPSRRLSRLLFSFILPACIIPVLCTAQNNILTYHNDNMRTGQNLSETVLTPANVTSATFGKLFTFPVDGRVDAQPLLVSGVAIPNQGAKHVIFAATEHDSLYAFDADTGAAYWQVSLLKAGETSSDSRGCGQVTPEIGITATPAIDLAAGPHGTIYVVAMSKDAGGNYHQRLHAIDITTGIEQFGGPVDIAATYPGTGDNSVNGNVVFDPKQYKERAGLLLVNGVVYTSWASHCDIRPYTGWAIGYNQTTLAQTSVFNFAPNGNESAIWGSGAGASADSSGNLFFQVANGTFDTTLTASGFPNKGDYGNAFVKLALTGGALSAVDYWNMDNTVAESNVDEDLGSGGVLILPDLVDSTGKVRHLGVGAGKDRNVYMFDRDNMGKFNANNNGTLYQELVTALSGGEFGSPAWFNGNLYFGSVGDVIRSFKMTAARLGTTPSSSSAASFAFPGTTPSVSANGTANGILWAIQNSNPAVLHAYDANDLVTELYNSNQAASARDQFGAGNKFITPSIGNGKVYVGTPNSVAVFGLLATTSLTSITPASGAQGATVNVTLAGTNFTPGTTVSVAGTGVTAGNVTVVSTTQITAALTITAAAVTGTHNVSVTTTAGASNTVPFTVTAVSQAPTLTSIIPTSGVQGSSISMTLNGTGFTPQSGVRFDGSAALFSNVVVLSTTQITAKLNLLSTTATGVHNIDVTTAAGISKTLPFTVTAQASKPVLTSVTPNGGTQGAAVNVTLSGANFIAGATVSISGTGVTPGNVKVVSATQITATLTVGAAAVTGGYNVSVVTTAGTSSAVTFTVTGSSRVPVLTSISPSSGKKGTTVDVTLTGTGFTSRSRVRLSGSGVSHSNTVVVSSTEITVRFTLSSTAATGAHDVSVRSSTGNTNTLPFTVN